jgi:glycosyltransferase involved in cell wall biosynthesis
LEHLASDFQTLDEHTRHRDDLAVIIPAFNERENVAPLFAAIAAAFERHGLAGEVVFVDDGSTDGTADAAAALIATFSGRARLCRHARNLGKTEALLTGVRATQRRYIVLLDADLQYDPEEIPRFLAKLDEGYDLVAGRKVGEYGKRAVSGVYNWLSRRLFDVPVTDLNGMKACRRELMTEIPLRHDWHRFFVVLAHERGYRLAEIDVAVRPRNAGTAKYDSARRIPPAVGDLLVVWFGLRVSQKPMHFFGGAAAWLFGAGGILGLVTVALRAASVPPPPIGYRPLIGLVAVLLVSAIVLFGFGVVGELVATLRGEVESLRWELRSKAPDDAH